MSKHVCVSFHINALTQHNKPVCNINQAVQAIKKKCKKTLQSKLAAMIRF